MNNPDLEYALDLMYESWLECQKKDGNKHKHPSRETYGKIIKYAQLWNRAIKEVEKARLEDG